VTHATAAHRLQLQPVPFVRGTLAVPGDKSLSHRYLMLGAIAQGVTRVAHLAPGADVASTAACVRALGASVDHDPASGALQIIGCGRQGLQAPTADLDAGNSGTTMRLLAGLLAGHPFRSRLVGDASLSRRPMARVIDPLSAMGARFESDHGRAPLVIDGARLHAIDWTSPVASAQVKSAILFAGLLGSGVTSIREPLATRDHTERVFPTFGLTITVDGLVCRVNGGQAARAPQDLLTVPGDPSSAAVWAAAAGALPGSDVTLTDVCLNPLRLGFLKALARMGARVDVIPGGERAGEPVGAIRVAHTRHEAATIDAEEVPGLIDELPVLAGRAALGARLEVSGAGELRHKESDRISALVSGLRALGVDADERPDGFVVDGRRRPSGGQADAVGDHRLVMAFAVTALGASGPSVVTGAEAVGVSYPGFAEDLARVTR